MASTDLNCPLKLKEIALHARNAEYNPRRFAAVIMRIKEPKATGLVFASGKMVCTGARSEESARIASRKFARTIQKLGFPVSFTQFKIQNVVGTSNIGFALDLEKISNIQANMSTYEPEIFPGLIYRMLEPKVCIMMFVSGKLVFTGAKSKSDTDEAFLKIMPLLETCRKRQMELD